MYKFIFRISAFLVCVAAVAHAVETFPVVHHEPITLRVLDGRDGRPLAHVRLQLVGGYNQHDLAVELWYGEAMTNADGEARLPDDMANLPLLRVSAAKQKLCQSGGRPGSWSVERIRLDGFSMPNYCGPFTVANAAGVFIIFARGSGPAEPAAESAPQAAHPALAPPSQEGPAGSGSSMGAGEPQRQPDPEGTAADPDAYQQMCHPDD